METAARAVWFSLSLLGVEGDTSHSRPAEVSSLTSLICASCPSTYCLSAFLPAALISCEGLQQSEVPLSSLPCAV